jgi:hypothetical protein
VNQTDIAQIVQELRRKHPGATDASDLGDFELTLGLLPEAGVWRIADLTPSFFALLPGNALFSITLGHPPAQGLPGTASLSSRAVEAEKLVARLEWGEHISVRGEEVWRRTHWTFRFGGQLDEALEEWQQVTGHVRTDGGRGDVDRDEYYARGLLARIGRGPAPGGSVAALTADQSEEAPEPTGAAGEQVTDIWGNPLDRRRRRRR